MTQAELKKISKILIVTLEPIGDKMAGPAIRALEIGKRLSSEFPTTVFSPVAGSPPAPDGVPWAPGHGPEG